MNVEEHLLGKLAEEAAEASAAFALVAQMAAKTQSFGPDTVFEDVNTNPQGFCNTDRLQELLDHASVETQDVCAVVEMLAALAKKTTLERLEAFEPNSDRDLQDRARKKGRVLRWMDRMRELGRLHD